MPVQWLDRPAEAPAYAGAFAHRAGDPPFARARLWPHRSLPKGGFAFVIGVTFVMGLVPALPALGTPVFWGLLPFVMAALAALYLLLQRSYRDGELEEEVELWSDRLAIRRHNPRGPEQIWEADPFFVRLHLHDKSGPVPNYLTLSGGHRDVELGAFLSPEERGRLYDELDRLLKRVPR